MKLKIPGFFLVRREILICIFSTALITQWSDTAFGGISSISFPAKYSDAEILAMIIAVDLNEINVARAVQKEIVCSAVLDYANMVHTAHSKNMKRAEQLADSLGKDPSINSEVKDIKKKGADELSKLIDLDSVAFQAAYLEAIIKGHAEILRLIDNKLMNNSDNVKVKAFLKDTRACIVNHLESAKKLKG